MDNILIIIISTTNSDNLTNSEGKRSNDKQLFKYYWFIKNLRTYLFSTHTPPSVRVFRPQNDQHYIVIVSNSQKWPHTTLRRNAMPRSYIVKSLIESIVYIEFWLETYTRIDCSQLWAELIEWRKLRALKSNNGRRGCVWGWWSPVARESGKGMGVVDHQQQRGWVLLIAPLLS